MTYAFLVQVMLNKSVEKPTVSWKTMLFLNITRALLRGDTIASEQSCGSWLE